MSELRRASRLVVCLGLSAAACGGSSTPPQQQTPAAQSPAAGQSPTAAPQPPPPPASTSDQLLASEVARFLDSFVAKQRPQEAVEGKASRVLGDRRFVPPATMSPGEYKAAQSAAASPAANALSPAAFESSLQKQLEVMLSDPDEGSDGSAAAPTAAPKLESLLVPFPLEAARQNEVWEHIGAKNPRSLSIAGVPSVAYQARAWNDIKWTASDNIGLQFGLEDLVKTNGVNVQAVVTRFKPMGARTAEWLLVTIWSDEGRGGSEWRYVGVVPQT
jgi:hypothetical protein